MHKDTYVALERLLMVVSLLAFWVGAAFASDSRWPQFWWCVATILVSLAAIFALNDSRADAARQEEARFKAEAAAQRAEMQARAALRAAEQAKAAEARADARKALPPKVPTRPSRWPGVDWPDTRPR